MTSTNTVRARPDYINEKAAAAAMRDRLLGLPRAQRWGAIALAFQSADLTTVQAIVDGSPYAIGVNEYQHTQILILSGRLRAAVTRYKSATSPAAIANAKTALEALARDVLALGDRL